MKKVLCLSILLLIVICFFTACDIGIAPMGMDENGVEYGLCLSNDGFYTRPGKGRLRCRSVMKTCLSR